MANDMSPNLEARLRVTFYVNCPILKREFRNVEIHRSEADARLRARALNWQIEKIEPAKAYSCLGDFGSFYRYA